MVVPNGISAQGFVPGKNQALRSYAHTLNVPCTLIGKQNGYNDRWSFKACIFKASGLKISGDVLG